ncbi:GerAB/ArcD/ProY family transporter [Paenibacillus agaridevorans]|uniref:GerAB/ArcD/ProY family transporter n=1 Tax=Paenibacillus agaridevorans TaxID=171404 RepID=UPI001BE46CE1|nr:GerAB/ArcD/ProY family transporter [Paenibacillus agaridevorans]
MSKFYLLFSFLVVHMAVFFFAFPDTAIGVDTYAYWMPLSFLLVFEWALLGIYMKGLSFFPGRNLADALNETTGKWIASLVLLPMMIYMLSDIILMARNIAAMIIIVFLPKTPLWALLCSFIVVPVFCAASGLHTILRSCALFITLFLPILLFSIFSAASNVDFYNALPILDRQPSFLTDRNFYSSTFAISPFLYLGMARASQLKLFPNPRYGYLAFFGLLLLLLVSVYWPILIFGKSSAETFHFPFVMALDTVNLEWFLFDRITMFFIISVAVFSSMHSALTLWALSKIAHSLFGKIRREWYIVVLGFLFFAGAYSIPNYDWIEQLTVWQIPWRMYSIVGIPLFILTVGLWRRRRSA